jgi:hypothetical protein
VLVFVFSFYGANAQLKLTNLTDDSLRIIPERNYIEYGVDKVNNTYLFTGNAFYKGQIGKSEIEILQSYRGLGLQQNTQSFRDDESLTLRYYHPIADKLKIVGRGDWFYSADTRTFGQNELNRINGLTGLKYDNDNAFVELTAGYEHNNQIGVKSPGFIMNLNSAFREMKFANYTMNTRLNGEILKLNMDRMNADMDFFSMLYGDFGRDNHINFDFGYRLMKRDLLSTWLPETDFIPIEKRLENNLMPGLNFGFGIFPGLTANVSLFLNNYVVNKSYNKPVDKYSISKMNRQFREFQFAVNSELRYNFKDFSQTLGLLYSTRSEQNKAYKKFDISDIEEEEIQELESMRDNVSSRTKLIATTNWTTTPSDTIRFDFATSIYRYDTPSDKNYDDRDEFNFNTGLAYMHRFNEGFSAGIFTKIQMLHLVFLNAKRSAMNNWNRILRLGTQVKWHNRVFSINPVFEVIANYTIYDFEEMTGSIRSYSFRQLGYRDSLCIYLDDDVSLQGRVSVRYFERGILYWDTFSESPQNSNLEYFVKALAYARVSDVISVAAGIRIYSLEQRNIINNVPSTLTFSQFSLGPETVLSVKFFDGTTISLQGWYEFQYINKLQLNKIPNLFLLTNVAI